MQIKIDNANGLGRQPAVITLDANEIRIAVARHLETAHGMLVPHPENIIFELDGDYDDQKLGYAHAHVEVEISQVKP